MEGPRPQKKEAAFDAGQPQGAFTDGERYERSDVYIGKSPLIDTRLKNGKPEDIVHLYSDHDENGIPLWRTERQSITNWQKEVRAGHERKDPRYERVSEDQVPSLITHTSTVLYRSREKPIYGYDHWVHIEFGTPADEGPGLPPISFRDQPEAATGKGAEPEPSRTESREERPAFSGARLHNSPGNSERRRTSGWGQSGQQRGTGENTFRQESKSTETEAARRVRQEGARINRITEEREDAEQGSSRHEWSGGNTNRAKTEGNSTTSDERGDLYADIGLSSPEFKRGVGLLRDRISHERARQGERFNGAEFVQKQLLEEIDKIEASGKIDKEEVSRFRITNIFGWYALAFNFYGEEAKKSVVNSIFNLSNPAGKTRVKVDSTQAALLDVAATALDIPHVPGQQIIPFPLETIEGLKQRELTYRERGIHVVTFDGKVGRWNRVVPRKGTWL